MKEASFTLAALLIALVMMTGLFGESSIVDFHLASWGMGIGIAIDVALATLGKFKDKELSFWNWTLPICLTHIGFPAVGYLLTWIATEHFPSLRPILGTFGFLLVAAFVYEVLCESLGKEPVWGISDTISKAIGFAEDDTRRIIAILAVSWDALWSGPAKSAPTANWSDAEVYGSFIIAGIVVAAVAQASLLAAIWLRNRRYDNIEAMALWIFRGKNFELTVIGGFGVMSLLVGFSLTDNILVAMAISAVIVMGTFQIFRKEAMEASTEEAEEAINVD